MAELKDKKVALERRYAGAAAVAVLLVMGFVLFNHDLKNAKQHLPLRKNSSNIRCINLHSEKG